MRSALAATLLRFAICILALSGSVTLAEDEVTSEALDILQMSPAAVSQTYVQAGMAMPWTCEIGSVPQFASQELSLRYQVIRVSHGHQVMSGRRTIIVDGQGQAAPVDLHDVAPTTSGVYELRLELTRSSASVWPRLMAGGETIATFSQAMLVLPNSGAAGNEASDQDAIRPHPISQGVRTATQAIRSPFATMSSLSMNSLSKRTNSLSDTEWAIIGVLRPSAPSWLISEWIPETATRLIPGMHKAGAELKTDQHHDEKISLLDPKSVFQATLPVMAPGMPHRVSLRIPSHRHQLLRIDIGPGDDQASSVATVLIQGATARPWSNPIQNESSTSSRVSLPRLPSVPRLAGLVGDAEETDTTEDRDAWTTHTLVYYPSGDDQVWVTNLGEDTVAAFESIEVSAGPARLRAERTQSEGSNHIVMNIHDDDWVTRLTRDWIPSNESNQCDQETVGLHRSFLAVERICDYASLHGANAICLPASAVTNDLNVKPLLPMFEQHGVAVYLSVDLHSASELTAADVAVKTLQTWLAADVAGSVIAGVVCSGAANPTVAAKIGASVGSRPWYFSVKHSRLTPELRSGVNAVVGRLLVTCVDEPAASGMDGPAAMANDSVPFAIHATRRSSVDRSVVVDGNTGDRLYSWVQRFTPAQVFLDVDLDHLIVEPHLEDVCQKYLAMSAGPIEVVQPSDPNERTTVVTTTIVGDEVRLEIANLAPWDSRVSLIGRSDSHSRWEQVGSASAEAEDSSRRHSNQWLVPARRSVVLNAAVLDHAKLAEELKAMRWMASIDGGEDAIAAIKDKVTTVVERIGMLAHPPAYPGLQNGGFEVTGEMGLVGWMHAQHPPRCVSVDSSERVSGKHSVCLTTDTNLATRTWLVSETISPPRTGRLSVSMACRAEPASKEPQVPPVEGAATHTAVPHPKVRVSIEGTLRGSPFQESVEIEVPRTGVWQPRLIVLETTELNAREVDSLRLTIDSLSSGKIWIDDVSLHDYFPTAKERSELQNQAFLAVQGLQRGSLTPSAKLLHNHWAIVLLENGMSTKTAQQSRTTGSLSAASQPEDAENNDPLKFAPLGKWDRDAEDRTRQPVDEPSESEAPSVAERFREWLPSPLRF